MDRAVNAAQESVPNLRISNSQVDPAHVHSKVEELAFLTPDLSVSIGCERNKLGDRFEEHEGVRYTKGEWLAHLRSWADLQGRNLTFWAAVGVDDISPLGRDKSRRGRHSHTGHRCDIDDPWGMRDEVSRGCFSCGQLE